MLDDIALRERMLSNKNNWHLCYQNLEEVTDVSKVGGTL